MKFIAQFFLSIALSFQSLPAFSDWESHLVPSDFDTASKLELAIPLAKEKNKAVILYYTLTNCPPCAHLQALLRGERNLAKPYREGYVFTGVWRNSISTNEREDYRRRYDAIWAPTWVVFNSQGEYVCTSVGGFGSVEAGMQLHRAIQTRLSNATSPRPSGPTACVAK